MDDAPANKDLEFNFYFNPSPSSYAYSYDRASRVLNITLVSATEPVWINVAVDWKHIVSTYLRKLDSQTEGFDAQLYHNVSEDVQVREEFNVGWNLVYSNQNEYDPDHPESFTNNNPVNCFLYPDTEVQIDVMGGLSNIEPIALVPGRYYYFFPEGFKKDDYRIDHNNPAFKVYKLNDDGTRGDYLAAVESDTL